MLYLLLTLFFPPVPVQPETEAPKGPPPQIVFASIDKEGKLSWTVMLQQYVTEYRQTTVENAGKKEVRTVAVTVPVTRMVKSVLPLDKATITEAGGKKIDKKTLAQRLAKPAVVVLSADGQKIDAGYLKAFKKDVIVIVAPHGEAGGKKMPRVLPAAPPEKIPPPKD
jgi:hypothetical protein